MQGIKNFHVWLIIIIYFIIVVECADKLSDVYCARNREFCDDATHGKYFKQNCAKTCGECRKKKRKYYILHTNIKNAATSVPGLIAFFDMRESMISKFA